MEEEEATTANEKKKNQILTYEAVLAVDGHLGAAVVVVAKERTRVWCVLYTLPPSFRAAAAYFGRANVDLVFKAHVLRVCA